MDSFTERMLERARARQKKIDEHYNMAGETPKKPLQETNTLLNKLENATNLTKSQPNLTECSKIKRKEVASDPNINTKTLYDSSLKENLSDSNLTKYARQGCTLVSSQSSPKSPTKTLNIQQENFNMEIKLTSNDNIRFEVEIAERDESDDDNSNDNTPLVGIHKINHKDKEQDETIDKPAIRDDAKKRLQRLGKLYAGVDVELSSPIHRTEAKFSEDVEEKDNMKPATICGLGRLKALANTRNQWEDEISTTSTKVAQKDIVKKSWKPPAPKPPVMSSQVATPKTKYPAPKPPVNVHAFTRVTSREASPEKSTSAPRSPEKVANAPKTKSPVKERPTSAETKQLAWDQAVMDTLESQGFTRTNSNARLIYNYKESDKEQTDEKTKTKVSKLDLIVNEDETEEEEEVNEEEIEEKINEDIPVPIVVSKIASKFKEQFEEKSEKSQFKPRSPTKSGDISNRVAMFEQASPSKTKDPALLSVSERKALFEKNKGAALIPKAAFGMAAPLKIVEKETPINTNVTVKSASPSKPTNIFSKPSTPNKKGSPSKQTTPKVDSPATASIKQSGGIASKMRALLEKKSTISQKQINSGVQEQRQKEMDLLLNRFNKQKEVEEQITEEDESNEEEEEEDDENISETTKMIAARAAKIVQFKGSNAELSPPPPPPPPPQPKSGPPKKRRSKGDSPKVREVLEDVKRIRISPPKAGRMYPNLSDIEAITETEHEQSTATPSPDSSFGDNSSSADSEGPNTSFGREIMQVVCKNQTPQKRPILNESTASDLSDVLDDMDDYLDEALAAEDSDSGNEGPTPPKLGKRTPPRRVAAPSHSFNYQNFSPAKQSPTKGRMTPLTETDSNESTQESDLPTHIMDGENILPLTHTVSFYRKQQAQGSRTPIRQIQRQAALIEESPEKEDATIDEKLEVQSKIQELLETVSKQQTVISQASQALNLCISTIEFSGSSEQVEAERLLLVATQRRQAALHEVQRLRVEGTLHSGGGICSEKGTLTISDICFPLKKEYARALSSAGGMGHHVVCLVRSAEYVLPTRIASTQASPRDNLEMQVRIPGHVRLENVYSDFTATIEVYTLQAQEEILPHEVKYHIGLKKGGNKLTPKKSKQDSKLMRPSVQSPAGPQAVRSPSFALMGYVVFSLQGISRTQWTLNNTPAMSPLEGSVQMKIKCELAISVEHRGFLSMFDDVSGFGAWHRRWCLVKGNNISYWKYPDEERKKAPIDSINLQTCTTKLVGQVTREICARPHTFLLETVRSARPSDSDSLVTVCQGERTIIRHLLSADTKEERIIWCEELNKALRLIRFVGASRTQ